MVESCVWRCVSRELRLRNGYSSTSPTRKTYEVSQTISLEDAFHKQVRVGPSNPLTNCYGSLCCKLAGEGITAKHGIYQGRSCCCKDRQDPGRAPDGQGYPCRFCCIKERSEVPW